MNWGYKIMVVYAVFVAGILFLVFKSSNQKMDLVTSDYYGEELKFQDKIDENKNTAALSGEVEYKFQNDSLLINFPTDFEGKNITGNAVLYYPADKDKDIAIPIATAKRCVAVKLPASSKGLHELHISWQVNGVNYYYEKKIFI